MGCFSFMCKECGKAILSNSFRGQHVELFLLKEGKVLQHMSGQYDSYGRVFTKDLKDSVKWNNPGGNQKPSEFLSDDDVAWGNVCDLMFSDNLANGISAIHTKCWNGKFPVERSDDDPNQGWGDDCELMANDDHELFNY